MQPRREEPESPRKKAIRVDSPEPSAPTRCGTVIERFAPSSANVIGGWVFAALLLASGSAFNAFFLREAALMPGNLPMKDGQLADRLVRGVLPTLLGWVVIGFGVGLARYVQTLQRQWVELCDGGVRHNTKAGIREVPWRMVTAIHKVVSQVQLAGVSSEGGSIEILVKRGESLGFTRDSVHKFKRFSRLLHERATAEAIPWQETALDLR